MDGWVEKYLGFAFLLPCLSTLKSSFLGVGGVGAYGPRFPFWLKIEDLARIQVACLDIPQGLAMLLNIRHLSYVNIALEGPLGFHSGLCPCFIG